MHSLPGRLHSLVYLREFRAPTKREVMVRAEKRKGQTDPRGAKRGQGSTSSSDCLEALPRYISGPVLSHTAYIVSSVYEGRFKPFTLAFTLLTPLRLRSLRMPLAAFLATTPRHPAPLRYQDQRASPRVKGRNPPPPLSFPRFTQIPLCCL